MRSLVLVFLVACGGGISEPIHEVVDCEREDRQCEVACVDPEPSDVGTCMTADLNGRPFSCGDFGTPVVDYMGTLGCCVVTTSDDVRRFFECE